MDAATYFAEYQKNFLNNPAVTVRLYKSKIFNRWKPWCKMKNTNRFIQNSLKVLSNLEKFHFSWQGNIGGIEVISILDDSNWCSLFN